MQIAQEWGAFHGSATFTAAAVGRISFAEHQFKFAKPVKKCVYKDYFIAYRNKMISSKRLSGPMRRLEEVAADAGKVLTRHAFLKPDEAALILDEIQRLRSDLRQLQQFMLLQDEGVLSENFAESGSAPRGPPVIDPGVC